MKRLNLILGSLFLSLNVVASPLVILGDDSYKPIVYLENHKPEGLLVDSVKIVVDAMKMDVELKLLPWARAYHLAEDGSNGIIGISKTEERSKIFDFSDPIAYDDIVIVVKKGKEFPYSSVTDLTGKRIGIQNGASYGDAVDQAIRSQAIQATEVNFPAQRLEMLAAGRLDAVFIGNGITGVEIALKQISQLKNAKEEFTILPTPLVRDKLYLAFHKKMGKKAFIDAFNRTLADLANSGRIPGLLGSGTR